MKERSVTCSHFVLPAVLPFCEIRNTAGIIWITSLIAGAYAFQICSNGSSNSEKFHLRLGWVCASLTKKGSTSCFRVALMTTVFSERVWKQTHRLGNFLNNAQIHNYTKIPFTTKTWIRVTSFYDYCMTLLILDWIHIVTEKQNQTN